jgi:NAD(P)-binding Rossmann-like domain/Flavin containing amine oxidoreductase
MPSLSRRSFLAASAMLEARPSFAQKQKPASDDADVIIVGAGAAGIAAARRLTAEKVKVIVVEAQDRIGGRCVTDTKIFGVPFDLGAHWIAPRWQSVRIGPRRARDAELDLLLATQVRAQRAMREPIKSKTDVPASRMLPQDFGVWRPTLEFMFGLLTVGKDLNEVSAFDLARAAERAGDAFSPQGYGALLARLASGLNIRRSRPVRLMAWGKSTVLETEESLWYARGSIVTCSTNVLLGQDIEFIPSLPKRVKDAAAQLALGSLDHIALDLAGNRFRWSRQAARRQPRCSRMSRGRVCTWSPSAARSGHGRGRVGTRRARRGGRAHAARPQVRRAEGRAVKAPAALKTCRSRKR